MADGAAYEVTVSQSGLVARPLNEAARLAVGACRRCRAVRHDGRRSGNVNLVADPDGTRVADYRRERRVGGDEAALH